VVFLGGLLLLSGCGTGGPSAGAGSAGISIGETYAECLTFDSKPALIIWTDKVGAASAGSSSSLGSSESHGTVGPQSAPWVKWQCQTTGGKIDKVTINGVNYALQDGPLFLVSVKGGQAEVRQLKRDLARVNPTKGGLEEFARNDPEVAKFVADADGPK
jgi:hypothetical protein